MAFETMRVEADGPVGRLTLNRPEKLNAINPQMLRETVAAGRWFDERPDVRVVIVSGAGRSFSAGFDLRASGDAGAGRETADLGRRAADALESMRAVVVAAVRGHCIGGGVVLLVSCDLRVAATDASFAIPEVDLGIPLAWGGIPRLVREIGPGATRDLVMTCRTIGAEEACSLGLLNRVVDPADLDGEVDRLASQLAEKAPYPLLATKRQVDAVTAGMVGPAHSWADADLLGASLRDPASQKAAQRYLEQRMFD